VKAAVRPPLLHLFVYGTLRRGEVRWPHLAPLLAGPLRADSASGRLYDTGRGYPAAVFGATKGTITGETGLLRSDGLDDALALLDEIEGAVHDLYRRVVVTTASGVTAWAYEYVGRPDFPRIESGDWLRRPG
jgi:gamma-glutamylcyclotransferase (GGCT)/AIG2-like uncharacterized protein YtfP